jgi:pimeloyl-ACP methyl ester carboxylesterase
MQHFLFLAGPPAGKRMWDPVLARVRAQGAQASAIDVLDLYGAEDQDTNWIAALGAQMAHTSPCVLIAHGTAVPLALHAAAHHPPAGLVLSNGPLGPLPPSTRALLRTLRALGRRAALQWLASSAGLRRTVINPYVWDHDTVVTVCGPLFEADGPRGHTREFLQALPGWAAELPLVRAPTVLIWGDSDSLFSSLNADISVPGHKLITIDGARYFHPLERPWEIADRVLDWSRQTLITT